VPDGETFSIEQPTHVLVNFATSTDRDSQHKLVYIKEYTCDEEFSEHVQVRIPIVWPKDVNQVPAGYFRIFINDKTRGKKEIQYNQPKEDAYYVIEEDFLIIYTKHFCVLEIRKNGELMLSETRPKYNCFKKLGVRLYYKPISISNTHKLEMFLRIVNVDAEKKSERDWTEFKHVDLLATVAPAGSCLPFNQIDTFEYILLSNPSNWMCIQPNETQVSALE
jgi:hypothetical protein